jgi:hypothetical protein
LSRLKKMLLAAVAGMAVVSVVAASPASATVPTEGKANAEQANVPYLAWRGEHVRLGYCNPLGEPEGTVPFTSEDKVTWHIEDWSGVDYGSIPVPYLLEGSQHFDGNGCAYASFASQKAGVAFIKLDIVSASTGATLADKHFLVGWMQMTSPVLSGGGDVTAGDFNCEPAIRSNVRSRNVEDPSRVCSDDNDPLHRVTATVKGIIPLRADFDEWAFPASGPGSLVTPGQLTLPDDWNAWAQVAANDNVDHPNNALPSDLAVTNWDIHDSQASSPDNHVDTGGTQCDPPEVNDAGTTDTVDNCTLTPKGGDPAWGDRYGSFSTVFGVPSRAGHTDGPFDPLYPFDTMLSDGIVDAGDAPMPAAQIDVDIAENTGGADKGGVGYLYPLDKTVPYSRDGKGTLAGHNLDSPFYQQYLPATSRTPDADGSPFGAVQPTGIDGASTTGGFSGFLNNNGLGGLYDNWDFAWNTSYHPGTDSQCLWYQSVFRSYDATYRPLPYGDSSVSLYTDEHGEADVWYVPGFGFYFPPKNSNGGCDLRGVDPLGTAHVIVTARYPYQPSTIGDPPSAAVDYTVHSEFQKTLQVLPKGGDRDTSYTRIVLAHAQDIDGSPLEHETVCWTSNDLGDGAITAFPSGPGGDIWASYDAQGNGIGDPIAHIDPAWAHDPDNSFVNAGRYCTTTDENGNTAIEFSESKATTVDVVANWVNEALTRDTGEIPFGVQSLGALTDSGPVSHIPSPALVKAAAAASASGALSVGPVLADGSAVKAKVIKSAKVTKKALHKIRLARVYKPFHGKRALQILVNGKKGMVALRITIKTGKTTHVYTRFVLANQKVAVKNLPIPVTAAKVTVSLIG